MYKINTIKEENYMIISTDAENKTFLKIQYILLLKYYLFILIGG